MSFTINSKQSLCSRHRYKPPSHRRSGCLLRLVSCRKLQFTFGNVAIRIQGSQMWWAEQSALRVCGPQTTKAGMENYGLWTSVSYSTRDNVATQVPKRAVELQQTRCWPKMTLSHMCLSLLPVDTIWIKPCISPLPRSCSFRVWTRAPQQGWFYRFQPVPKPQTRGWKQKQACSASLRWSHSIVSCSQPEVCFLTIF